MRFYLATSLLVTYLVVGDSFTASQCRWRTQTALFSTTNPEQATETMQATQEGIASADIEIDIADIFPMADTKDKVVPLTADEINTRLNRQLAKLRAKDQTSKQLKTEVCSLIFGCESPDENLELFILS
jgi:hypothetical protein